MKLATVSRKIELADISVEKNNLCRVETGTKDRPSAFQVLLSCQSHSFQEGRKAM